MASVEKRIIKITLPDDTTHAVAEAICQFIASVGAESVNWIQDVLTQSSIETGIETTIGVEEDEGEDDEQQEPDDLETIDD